MTAVQARLLQSTNHEFQMPGEIKLGATDDQDRARAEEADQRHFPDLRIRDDHKGRARARTEAPEEKRCTVLSDSLRVHLMVYNRAIK